MTNWIAANVVTWLFDMSSLKNVVENTKSSYIYSTSYGLTEVDGALTYVKGAGVSTPKMGLDIIFPGSQVNGGIIIAILLAIVVCVMLSRTTLGYELKVCGSNRFAARYAGIKDKRNIVLSMAIAGALAGTAGALYYLAGNTEFYWNTYQSLPAVGFNGIPVALLASSNPIGGASAVVARVRPPVRRGISNVVSDKTDAYLRCAADDCGAGGHILRAQRHNQPGAGGHDDIRRVHRRAVRAYTSAIRCI